MEKTIIPDRAKPSDFPRSGEYRDPRTKPFLDDNGAYNVFSHADALAVISDREQTFTRDPSRWLPPEIERHPTLDFMWVLEPFPMDGQDGRHDHLRNVVEPWFKTRSVRTMEPMIREITSGLIDEIVERGTGEFNLADLGASVSMRVICRLVGIELDREGWVREKLDEVGVARGFDQIPRQWDADAYFWRMIARRLAEPQDELLDVLTAAWKDGTFSDAEMIGFTYGFVAAGTDTTATSLVNVLSLLSEFDYLDYVREHLDDTEAMRKVVEEGFRYFTSFPMKPFCALKEARFGDLVVPPGSLLQVWFSAANWDEAVNGGIDQSDPSTFDPCRWPNRHLAFGIGKHHCLGAELSRIETRTLLQETLGRLPELRLDETRPFARYGGLVDGVTEAHFTFDQDRAVALMRSAP